MIEVNARNGCKNIFLNKYNILIKYQVKLSFLFP